MLEKSRGSECFRTACLDHSGVVHGVHGFIDGVVTVLPAGNLILELGDVDVHRASIVGARLATGAGH